MPRKRFKTEEIIQKFREAKALLFQDENIAETCRQIGVIDQTYYRWNSYRSGEATEGTRLQDGTDAQHWSG